jgi:hypothetical protein
MPTIQRSVSGGHSDDKGATPGNSSPETDDGDGLAATTRRETWWATRTGQRQSDIIGSSVASNVPPPNVFPPVPC